MKKIISIAFAAMLVGLAISCQKEESVSEKTDAVQYTFNITVNDQVGFDSEASTKGGTSEKYKTGWESGDKIFLFFKPTSGSLLGDRYATLTYNESSWVGTVTEGQSSLGNGGTLSAVYVYKLDGSVTPAYSDSKWTIATGNTFYNCQTVSYTVSGNEISASLNLEAPANFVRFSVYSASGALTCDKVKGWKDIAIGEGMTFSNATCTGYMDGFTNSGDSNFKEYYGRIVSGTSLNNVACKFSVVKDNGTVYELTATPKSDARSFKIGSWTEAKGKLPGLFTISNGDDNEAGTADDVQVRFSKGNLVATINATGTPTDWKFATNQYDYIGGTVANTSIGNTSTSGTAGAVDLFGWSTASTTYGINTSNTNSDYSGDFKDWGTAIDGNGTWRTLSIDEWTYLINKNNDETIRKGKYKYGVTICEKTNCLILAPDDFEGTIAALYDAAAWATAEAAGLVCLPAAGYRYGSYVLGVGDYGCYWSSTAHDEYFAYYAYFESSNVYPGRYDGRSDGSSVRLITESK